MKNLLILILICLVPIIMTAQGMPYPRMNVTVGLFSSGSPHAQYYGAVGVVGTTGYTTSSVDNTYVLFDDKGHMYQVDSIVHIALGSTAYLYLNDLNSPAAAPTQGKGILCKRFSNGIIPLTADGSNYITPEIEAKILTSNMYYIDSLLTVGISSGTSSGGDRFRDTVTQLSHGLSLLDPVFPNSSGIYTVSNVSNEDSVHIGVVTQIINPNEFVVTFGGLVTVTSHGYTVGSPYFVQNDGSYSSTVESGKINDLAFTVITSNILLIHEQRPVSPSVDLNGIYSGSDTIPSGTISTAGNWLVHGNGLPNYYISFNPENDAISIRGDSVLISLGMDGLIVTDYRVTKKGIQNAANGYVTDPESLVTKRYVDAAAAAASVADGDKGDVVVTGLGSTWNIDTDAVGSDEIAAGAVGTSELAASGVVAGTYGSATVVPIPTIDITGRITSITTAAISVHDPVTVTDGVTIDFTLATQNISAEVKPESINASHIDTSAVTSSEILDGTVTTSDLAFTVNGGSGTANTVAKWTATNTLGNSSLTDDGVRVSFTSPFRANNWTTAGRPASPLTGDIGWNTTNANLDLYNGSAWINYAQHSSSTGLGTSTRIPYYDANGRLTDFSGLTFNGSNTFSFNGTGSTVFNIGPNSNFYYDAVNTGGQMTYRYSGTSAMTFPISGSTGFILNPSAANLTTSAGFLLSTGRTIGNEAAIRIMTTQNVTAGSGHYAGININNTLTPDAVNNISGSSIGGINIEQTYNTSSGTANQAVEYIGVRIVPTLNRNTASADAGYGVLISPTLIGSGTSIWYGVYNSSSTGYFLADAAGASNCLQGNTRMGYSLGTTNYKLHVTKNTGNYPMAVFAPAAVKMQIKGTTTETPFSSFGNYANFPSLSVIGSANSSTYEMTSMASGSSNRVSLFVGGQPISTGSASQYSILAHTSMQATPDASTTAHTHGVVGVSEYILQTAEDADTDLSGATYNYYSVAGLSKLSQAWSNGTQNFYSGYFDANGVNTSGGTNGTNMYGVWTSATGGTAGSWALYSDEGHNWLEDETRIGGTWSTPTANLDVDGSQRLRAISTPGSVEDGETWTSSTQKAMVSNQAGINQVLQGVIFTGTANASTSNTNTETTITPTGVGSLTLPANFFVAGKTIKVTVMGTYGTDAVTAPTLQLKLKLGSTEAVAFSANAIPTKTSNGLWVAEYNLTCRTTGASGTFAGYGEVELNDSETTRDATWKKSSSPTIDTTVSQAITITATFGTADTDNTITTTVFTVEILN